MPHDPSRLADTRDWLSKALRDLQTGDHDFKAEPPFLDAVVFHCQQAAEKALKGFLAWHDVPFRKTHHLEEIGEACLSIDGTLKEIIDRIVPLTEYAWRFRYPGEPHEPTLVETQTALFLARTAYEAILTRLPEEARP